MSWKKLEKQIAHTARRNILVGCSSNGGDSRFKQWFNLIFRADALQAPWLAVGKTVTVELGEGPDREYLRISAGGSFLLTRNGVKMNIDPATNLKIPALPFQHIAKRQLQPCEYQIDGNSLIITLPDWAVAPPPLSKRRACVSNQRESRDGAGHQAIRQTVRRLGAVPRGAAREASASRA